MFLAIKEFKKEKLRFGMILSVIVLISFLVYFLSSLAYGLSELNKTAIDHWDAEGVVISESSNKNLYASTLDLKDVENITGEYISLSNTNVSIEGSETTSLVFMGFEDKDSKILPKLIEGSFIEDDFEVLISANIRNEFDVKIGDVIKISDTKREFVISGFTEDSNFNTIPVVYGKREMVSDIMMNYNTSSTLEDANTKPTPNMPKRVSFVLIENEADIDPNILGDDLIYVDNKEIINELPGYKPQILTFGLMIISLSIIVAIIIGIFMYILTMQKKAIFAVLKIQGYKNKTITDSIIIQTLILIVSGLIIGFGANQLVLTFIPSAVPVKLNIMLSIIVSLFIMVTGLFGAIFSALSVLKIDPLEAL